MASLYQAFYGALENLGYTHPLHPTLIYVPIGTVMAAFIFGMIAWIWRRHQLAVTALHCIILAFIFVIPTILMGYVDWQYFHGGNWTFLFKMKILLAAVLVILLFTVLMLHRKRAPTAKLILLFYVLCFLTVVGLGYFGGEIVFGSKTRQADRKAAEGDGAGVAKDSVAFADVSQIFDQHCVQCHKGDNPPVELRLDTYGQVMAGSDKGPVVVPGKPSESELVLRITGEAEPAMPFRQPLLPDSTIQTIVRWVEQGAPNGATGAER
ncbi:MAG: c-type cytochrome domain-containing protein [Desulfosarcina sp.]